ncbi:hypothetical protein CC80DRAFT_207975 [Byssothecium circinans]|uniref:Uncharacterized protein n=1 Tax=Byssothecium circinans TaxID=147558 RepID=A0A6A5TIL1_9PLEO|nr:hypothetical protein CC80DRAFT_207975 [Byssothecium circinans]
MPHQGQMSATTRAAIVTLRCEGRGWVYISTKLANCSPNGASQFFNRVLARAGVDRQTPPGELSLSQLLGLLDDPHERGRRSTNGVGSEKK